MSTAAQLFGTGAYFSVSGSGTPGDPFIPQLSTGAAVAAVPLPGSGGYIGVASGSGKPGDPYVLAVGLSGGGTGYVTESHTDSGSGATFTNPRANVFYCKVNDGETGGTIVLPDAAEGAIAKVLINNYSNGQSYGLTLAGLNVTPLTIASGAAFEVDAVYSGGGWNFGQQCYFDTGYIYTDGEGNLVANEYDSEVNPAADFHAVTAIPTSTLTTIAQAKTAINDICAALGIPTS